MNNISKIDKTHITGIMKSPVEVLNGRTILACTRKFDSLLEINEGFAEIDNQGYNIYLYEAWQDPGYWIVRYGVVPEKGEAK